MAWFNFGKKDNGMGTKASVQKAVETVDAMRQRAKYRLIGAVVLVLAGVVGFPILFDSQPRPVAVDMPIEIPDKAKVRPLGAAPTPSAPSAPSAPAVAAKVDDNASLSGKEEIVTSSKPDAKAADKKPVAQSNNAQAASKAIAAGAAVAAAGAVAAGAVKIAGEDKAKAADKSADDAAKAAADKARKLAEEDKAKKLKAQVAEKAAADKVAEASRAKALLNGASPPSKPASAAGETRYIVQFGAFSDAGKAQEARRKVEKAGLKTYSQVAKTADGERIRVRVGPFSNKSEADKAAAKIKALDLPASILTL
jgi:DedD protein